MPSEKNARSTKASSREILLDIYAVVRNGRIWFEDILKLNTCAMLPANTQYLCSWLFRVFTFFGVEKMVINLALLSQTLVQCLSR